jgi:hypothetical protein
MHRRNIYQEFGMEHWGDAFEITVTDDISTHSKRLLLLDQICASENLLPLETEWTEMVFAEATALLKNALRYDLAYSSCENIPEDRALQLQLKIIQELDQESTYCYTNWRKSPWDGEMEHSWIPLTEHTFDLGILFLNQQKLIFVYFISED